MFIAINDMVMYKDVEIICKNNETLGNFLQIWYKGLNLFFIRMVDVDSLLFTDEENAKKKFKRFKIKINRKYVKKHILDEIMRKRYTVMDYIRDNHKIGVEID